ncbi:MAG TPA: lysophospholipid acyltransferase family protein [Thermoleophilaceae bacterium]|nr:lysophospholipid acyltransferase family protein [Thermoleophilaceae bacterium]
MTERRRSPRSRHGLTGSSALLGGPLDVEAGAEEPRPPPEAYDARSGALDLPRDAPAAKAPEPRDLHTLIPPPDTGRAIDDWGRSERVFALMEPVLDFYYRYWFRVEVEGVENVPAEGGALLVSNHSGALPPDGPMIMQAIRHEHPRPRPLYMLGEHWFKGYPGVGLVANKLGLVGAHPANAQRLLRDEGRLALVFPEGQKASRKLYWQRYRLRRFGRGGFVRTAIRAGVPIVPIAVIGAEEAMPIFAHVPLLQRLTGLIYFPVNHAFPQFGLAAAAMYLPAKFRIRFLEPVDLSAHDGKDTDDIGLVQGIAEEIRGRIQSELDSLVAARTSVWFG